MDPLLPETERLATPQEFSESAPPTQAPRAAAAAARLTSLDALKSNARNVAVRPDGTVLVTNDEGKVVARFADTAAARGGLAAAGVDLGACNVAGNLGRDAVPAAKAPAPGNIGAPAPKEERRKR